MHTDRTAAKREVCMCKAPLPYGGPGLPSPHLTYCFNTVLWALITGLRCQTVKFSKYSFADLVQHHVNRIGNQPLLGEEVVIFQSSPCECDLWFRFTSALLHSWGPLSSQVSLKLGSPETGKGNFPGLLRGAVLREELCGKPQFTSTKM